VPRRLFEVIRRALFSFAVALALTVPALADDAGSTGPVTVTVPDGTDVSVALVAPLTSADNNPNDGFDVRVTRAVNVGGYTIIAKDAPGRGHVSKIDRAGGHGHPGAVAVVIDYVFSVDGLSSRTFRTRRRARRPGTMRRWSAFSPSGSARMRFAAVTPCWISRGC
jgi:hypothetical protein